MSSENTVFDRLDLFRRLQRRSGVFGNVVEKTVIENLFIISAAKKEDLKIVD